MCLIIVFESVLLLKQEEGGCLDGKTLENLCSLIAILMSCLDLALKLKHSIEKQFLLPPKSCFTFVPLSFVHLSQFLKHDLVHWT